MGLAVDRELVLRARGGDKDAFASLVGASFGRLNAVARLILHDTELAEDAVQDALVDAWRDLRGLRDPDRFDAWLHRVLVNACYTQARRRSKHQVQEIHVLPEDQPATFDAERSIALSDEIERGLRRLPVDQRTLLVLVYYLDLPVTEAADIVGIPLGTAKSRLHRAINGLRAELAAVEREAVMAGEGSV
jgi:RNA polymerase sigma-70 factor, ECF subfamily